MALTPFMRKVSIRGFTVAALAVAVIAVPASLLAWGPNRPTYTVAHPADHVTFNSITDNPNIGDERNFVGIRESGTNGLWQDSQTVTPGKEYVVRLYAHNNAAANLKLVAKNVTAKVNLPTTTAKSLEVQGFINSSNASPTEVYDHAIFNASENFNLAVVPGSLKYYNNANGNGFTIPETLFTSTGAPLGYDKMDGNIPGCFQYAGYLTFIVKPQFAPKQDFSMNKLVSKHGADVWVDSYAATPGETVDYLLEYNNTGPAQQDNVTFRDTLPADQSYINGSAVYGNARTPSGTKASDNVTGVGVNVGSYAAGANAWFIFSAKVSDNTELDKCGPNTMTNSASVTTAYGSKSDTAVVTVNKACPKTPGISIKKTVNTKENATVAVNTPFTYELTVTNTGDTVLKNVIVSDKAPTGVIFTAATRGTIMNNELRAVVKYLAVKQTVTITVTAKVGTYFTGSRINKACVDAPEVTSTLAGTYDDCDRATIDVVVPTPGISIQKTVNTKEQDWPLRFPLKRIVSETSINHPQL